jgi:hypothetical protein
MQAGLKNAYEGIKAFSETDFTEDLNKFDVPTLVMRGEADQIVPVHDSARKSARLIRGAKGIHYPGAPHGLTATLQDRVNADLLAFLKSSPRSPPEAPASSPRNQRSGRDSESSWWPRLGGANQMSPPPNIVLVHGAPGDPLDRRRGPGAPAGLLPGQDLAMDAVLSWTSDDNTVRLPSTRIQPIAAADVVDAVGRGPPPAPRSRASATSPARTSSPSTTSAKDHPGGTAGRPGRRHRRPGGHVHGRHRRRTHRRTGRTPGTHALPGLDPKGPITGRSEAPPSQGKAEARAGAPGLGVQARSRRQAGRRPFAIGSGSSHRQSLLKPVPVWRNT